LGLLPLSAAIHDGNPKCIDFLLKKGADVNQFDDKGRPAWSAAALSERYDLNTMLIQQHGADTNIQNSNGDTVLHMATRARLQGPIAYLRCQGANPNTPNNSGESPASIIAAMPDRNFAIKKEFKDAMFRPVAPQDPYAPKKNSNSSLGM